MSFSEHGKSSVAHLAWTERSGVKRGEEEKEFEPRMDAKEREGKSYCLFVIGYGGAEEEADFS